mgnify:CR=1
MSKEDPPFHYQVMTMRLSDEVREQLKKEYVRSGKSWNLFIQELLNK